MLIYFLVLLIVYCTALIIEYKNSSRKWRILDIFILIVLIFFSGTRFNVGTDYVPYHYIYNNFISMEFSLSDFYLTSQEFGYYLFSLLTKKISSSHYAIFVTTAIITYIPIYSKIKKDSNKFSFSILLFFLLGVFTDPFNIIRQWIAISINFYSNQYINTNRKRFILLNIIASSFHISSILVMFIQLILIKIKPTFKLLAFTVISGVLITKFFTKLNFIFSFLEKINPRYMVYLDTNHCGNGLKLLILLRIMIIIYVLLVTKKTEYQYHKTLLIVSLFFMIIGIVNIPVARLTRYFDVFLIILLPNVVHTMGSKKRRLHQYSLTIIFLIVFILSLIFYGDLIPYKSYLIGGL